MYRVVRHIILLSFLLGFVGQAVFAMDMAAARIAHCNPAIGSVMQMSDSGQGSAGKMDGMPCHKQDQSCNICCKTTLQAPSIVLPAYISPVYDHHGSAVFIVGDQIPESYISDHILPPPNA